MFDDDDSGMPTGHKGTSIRRLTSTGAVQESANELQKHSWSRAVMPRRASTDNNQLSAEAEETTERGRGLHHSALPLPREMATARMIRTLHIRRPSCSMRGTGSITVEHLIVYIIADFLVVYTLLPFFRWFLQIGLFV